MSPEERKSSANALWLCNSCGRLVDNDASTYTVGELVQWKVDAIDRARKALASGGRATTEGLFAAQLEIQKQALAQQRENHDAQMREQQRSKFSERYTHFLQEAKAYADAIDRYWTWMHKTLFRGDRPTREAMQKPVNDARAALERALQPILLSDDDETRGRLRWELLRGRGLEPVIDTIENQKAYSEVIHYHHLRLLDGINRLQSNVRQELGLPVRATSAKGEEFEKQMFERARAAAEAVEAKIKAQFDNLMREQQARKSTRAGTPNGAALVGDSTTSSDTSGNGVRNRVWNVLQVEIFEMEADEPPNRRGSLTMDFLREIWNDVLSRPIDELPHDFVTAWKIFRQVVMSCPEPTFYAIVQHAGGDGDIREKLIEVLERSNAPYRFVGDRVVPSSSEHEAT